MKGLIASAIKNRKITVFAVVLVVIFGFYSYYIMPKQEAPDLNVSVAMITTVYPGASPEDVEKLVTSKIEDECAEVDGYDYSRSYSYNNLSFVVLWLESEADIAKAWSELRQKMDDLQSSLPSECRDIELNTDLSETAGFIISLSGNSYTYEELEAYGENFERTLAGVDGVSRVEITGSQKYQVAVEIDASKLNLYRPSIGNIADIIKSQNVEIPSGSLGNDSSKINVSSPGSYSSINEIQNTIIDVSEENGSIVRLKDIAQVNMELEDSNYRVKHDNKNAVLLTGYFKPDRNVVLIGQVVEEEINRLKSELPEDVEVGKVLFQPEDIRKSVNNFVLNLLEGVLFVIIVVFFGMGFRNAVIVSAAIPASILASLGAMNTLGVELHQISITALIIALGMLVDNAIVVSDSIQVKLDNGVERLEACVEGVKEVAVPVFTSTLTTIAAFLPLLMLPSMAGEYVASIPIIIIVSLFSSYLVALFITPTMAYIFFRKSKNLEKQSTIRSFFNTMLSWGMKRKGIVVVLMAAAVGTAAFLTFHLGLQFFPKADTNMIYINLKTEQNVDIFKTEELVEQVSEVLDNQPEISTYTAAIGNGLPKFYNTLQVSLQSTDTAQIMARLDLEEGERFSNNSEMVEYLQDIFNSKITAGTVTVKEIEIGEPIGSPIIARVTGSDLEQLGQTAEIISCLLNEIEGTVNVSTDFSDKIFEYVIDVDIDKAAFMGISKYDVQKEVNLALMGNSSSVFRKDGKEYDILIKSNIESKEELENLAIKSSFTSQKILLKEIAKIYLNPQVPTIKKYDRELAVTVFSDVKPGYNSVTIQDRLQERLKTAAISGSKVVFDGEKAKINEHFGNLGSSAVFAVLLIYGILLLQFRSFAQPFIILITVPLSAVGSILGLSISGQPLSFMALLGMVSLMGIVVNNAIVLIDYINSRRDEGMDIAQACIESADKRFRPIILTTSTTVIGLIPLSFSGSSLFTPLAVSLISGLIVSTVLTLVVIPVVYSLVEEKKPEIPERVQV